MYYTSARAPLPNSATSSSNIAGTVPTLKMIAKQKPCLQLVNRFVTVSQPCLSLFLQPFSHSLYTNSLYYGRRYSD